MIPFPELSKSLPQNPIFIVGFPRSGTTLLQSLLATQCGFCSFPETHFFCSIVTDVTKDLPGLIPYKCLGHIFRKIKEYTELEFSAEVSNHIRELANNNLLSEKILFEYLVLCFLLKQVEPDKLPEIRWLEKTPAHVFWLKKIHDFYPDAQFIEIIRNPVNAIYSWKYKFPDGDQHSVSSLAFRWRDSLKAFEGFRKEHPEKAFSVIYEKLVTDAENEFGKICAFLKIKANFDLLRNSDMEAKKFVLKREKWKENNTSQGVKNFHLAYSWPARERLKITYILRKELIQLGYCDSFSLVERIYNSILETISYLTRFRILEPLKPLGRFLFKQLSLWPFQG